MKTFSRIYLLFLLILYPVVLIATWVVGAYSPDVHSLLDADGVRWGVTHIVSNFARLPLSAILMLLVTLSIVYESGWLGWIFPKNHPMMLKQLRAYTYTNLLLIVICVLGGATLLMPESPLLNSLGGFEHSPLVKGCFPLLSLLLIFISNVYGYLSGRLTTSDDFAFAHTRLLRMYAPAFIPLFIVAQIGGCMDYSHLITFSSLTADRIVMLVLVILCFVR